jgi:hypothetical protein
LYYIDTYLNIYSKSILSLAEKKVSQIDVY